MSTRELGNALGNPLGLPRDTGGIGMISPYKLDDSYLKADGSVIDKKDYKELGEKLEFAFPTTDFKEVITRSNGQFKNLTYVNNNMMFALWASEGTYTYWYLAMSIDGGVTWTNQPQSTPSTVEAIHDYLLLDNNPNEIIITKYYLGGIYKSTNLGVTQTQKISIGTSKTTSAICQVGNVVFVSFSGGGTYRSTNRGDSFVSVANVHTSTNCMCSTPNGDMYLSTSSSAAGIYKSSDLGITWSLIPGTEGFQTVSNRSMAAGKDGTIMIVNATDGDVYRSTDNGVTWVKVLLGAYYSISSGDAGYWVVNNNTSSCRISRDNGDTWVSYIFPVAMGLASHVTAPKDTNANGVIIAGRASGNVVSGVGLFYPYYNFDPYAKFKLPNEYSYLTRDNLYIKAK